MELSSAVVHLTQKDRHIVVGIRRRIPTRPRAVKHDAIDTISVDFAKSGTESLEDRIVARISVHGLFYHANCRRSNWHRREHWSMSTLTPPADPRAPDVCIAAPSASTWRGGARPA